MSMQIEDMVHAYLRAISEHRLIIAVTVLVLSAIMLALAVSWPKNFTASASIYADNSNILQPLMENSAVATGIQDQARMAQDILFKREFTDEILEAAGLNPDEMIQAVKDDTILQVQGRTSIENISRNPANLIRISHTHRSPIIAFRVAQKYTSLFIEQSVIAKQEESRSAFNFIENQVLTYQKKLKESEARLSEFKSENNLGTLSSSNDRISGYRAQMETLELEIVQLDTQIASVEAQLAGENEVSRDLSEINAIRERINALQIQLDGLRARFHDSYPDVVQIKTQIADLQGMLESGNISNIIPLEELDENEGVTPLHQELRSQLAALRTSREAAISQHQGINTLLLAEEERARKINETEAELAELTRDYNVTQDFYNDMLKRLENARVSMHLDEEQQGVTFKVQESATIPTKPDGFSFGQLMMISMVLAFAAPIGLLVVYMELDTRIRSENKWQEEWPPLLVTVPPMTVLSARKIGNGIFVLIGLALLAGLYGGVAAAYLAGMF